MNKIETLTDADIPDILELWKKDRETLGIPFRKTIFDLLNNKSFFGVRCDGKLIAMCGYKIMKRNPSIRITKLCVDENYRKQGIALYLIRFIKGITKDIDLIMYAECKDGAENNSFYDKIGTLHHTEERKTMTVRFYKIDKI